MKALRSLSNEQVIEKGINALHRALGPTGTRHFINLARPRRENSVIHHRKLQEKLNIECLVLAPNETCSG